MSCIGDSEAEKVLKSWSEMVRIMLKGNLPTLVAIYWKLSLPQIRGIYLSCMEENIQLVYMHACSQKFGNYYMYFTTLPWWKQWSLYSYVEFHQLLASAWMQYQFTISIKFNNFHHLAGWWHYGYCGAVFNGSTPENSLNALNDHLNADKIKQSSFFMSVEEFQESQKQLSL